MEETETVIALGAGAITKYVYPLENRIERSANIKDVVGYIRKYEGAQ
jgi:oxygen-independent coproporphyrinogen-3 oxidase